MIAEFVVNNKTHLETKVSLFITNYVRELKMEVDIRRMEKATEFAERIKKKLKETGVALRKV